MDEQMNRTILDNFDVSSAEKNEIYKMNNSEVLKGLENASVHFITVPREEFIDHSLLPGYISTHGFIIDAMLDSPEGSHIETSQANSFTNESSGQLGNVNDIQLQSNIDDSDRRLSAALYQLVKAGNIRISGPNNAETQVIVTSKDLANLTASHVIDGSIKNDNSNSLDTSTFLTFDDQQSLNSSLINDGQFRIFQQPSPNNQPNVQAIQISTPSSTSLPHLAPIRRLNRNFKNSISINQPEQIAINNNIKTHNQIEPTPNYQLRPVAKKVLPHKKRITKKLKSIDVNQRIDIPFAESENSGRSGSTQIQFFQDMNEEINADEVINLNSNPQFACQICGLGAESQLEFFSHLKMHYEPIKSEHSDLPQIQIIRNGNISDKQFMTQSQQQRFQINQNENQKSIQPHMQTNLLEETSQYRHLPQVRRQIQENHSLHSTNQSANQARINNTSEQEDEFLLENKKIVEAQDLSDVSNFEFENYSQTNSKNEHTHSAHAAITKDIIDASHEYEILYSSIENHLQSEDSHHVQITKQSDFLNLQSTDQQGITLNTSSANLIKIIEPKSENSQLLQDDIVFSQSTAQQTSSEVEQNLFANTQYFETKFTGLPNQVLNLEQKIDAIRAENNISNSMSCPSTDVVNTDNQTTSSLVCEAQNCLQDQVQIAPSQSTNDVDGTENITPSIGQLQDETTLHSNSQKSSTNGIILMQHDEVEFSDPEDMLEGIRGVVDKVQESFDTGDEMEPMSPPRTNWFANNELNVDVNLKQHNDSGANFSNTNLVENFQMFFKNKPNNEKIINNASKALEIPENIVVNQDGSNNDGSNENNNFKSHISIDNSVASSTTKAVPSKEDVNKEISIKMENFSSDFEEDSWSPEYENELDRECSDDSFSADSNADDAMTGSPSSHPSDKETLKNCGVLSGKREKKKHFCEKCFKVFNSSNALKYHDFSHSGKRPFPCLVCGKSFFAQNALRAHERVHSGEKPFTCVDCGRAFRQWGDLNYHRVSLHSNEKNFQCEFCGKAFARKYSLVIHRRIHTQEKNYKCEFCPKTFRASSYLQNHRKIHTGEKPYECPTCNKKFRVCGDLRRHQKIHDRVANPKSQQNEPKTKKKENQQMSIDNVVTIQLSDTVINMPAENEDTSIANNFQKTNDKNQTDLNSTVYMYTSDGNLDQLFKTDNITSNQIKSISSPLTIHLTEPPTLDNTGKTKGTDQVEFVKPLTTFTSSGAALSNAYIITENIQKNKKLKKPPKKQKGKASLT